MKISIDTSLLVSDLDALKAVSPSDGDRLWVHDVSAGYRFYSSAAQGHVKPNSGPGYWLAEVVFQEIKAVSDSYDFESNSKTDVTGFDLMKLLCERGRIDYKQFRSWLQIYAATAGFSNLPENEKKVCAELFAVQASDQLTVYTLDQIKEFSKSFHRNSILCREERLRNFEAFIFMECGLTNAFDMVSDFPASFFDDYLNHGLEGKHSGDDAEGLFDYIDEFAGTTYAGGNGMRGKDYSPDYPLTLADMEAVADELLNILKGESF